MEQRTFHGNLSSVDLARALVAEFDHGNLQAQALGDEDEVVVQIAGRHVPASGGRTALTVHLSRVEDGVLVRVGQQQWLGVAASLGLTALMALRNPLSLLGRIDDLAEDLASLQLSYRVWETLERTAAARGASYAISERLRRITCPYCLTANAVGAPHCVACGAPLGPLQPRGCPNCGYVNPAAARKCEQCGWDLSAAA